MLPPSSRGDHSRFVLLKAALTLPLASATTLYGISADGMVIVFPASVRAVAVAVQQEGFLLSSPVVSDLQ